MKPKLNSQESSEICKRCGGFCCKYHLSRPEKDDKDLQLYWSHRACPKFEPRDSDDPTRTLRVVQDKCPQLDENGRCKVYNERSNICRTFPKESWNDSDWYHFCELMRLLYPREKTAKEVMKVLK